MTPLARSKHDHDPHKIGARKPSELRVGDAVKFYAMLPQRPGVEPLETKISSEPWQLGDGTWVVKVDGKSGGVSTQFLGPPTS